MANIYLDANKVLDLAYRKTQVREELDRHHVFLSPLSIHILCYTGKRSLPDEDVNQFIDGFHIVDLTKDILEKSLSGPTSDLEDNIQLHSAAEAECDYFLTSDKRLLAMKFFGKTRIMSTIDRT